MSKTQTELKIEHLHQCYVRDTGIKIGLGHNEKRIWFDWLKVSRDEYGKEWNEQDLTQTISHVHREHNFRWFQKMVRLSNFIGRPDRFNELLGEANSKARAPKAHKKLAHAMRGSWMGSVPKDEGKETPDKVVHISTVIAAMRKAVENE